MSDIRIDTFTDLQNFIGEFCGITQNKIRLDSKLEQDLKVYGDDAVDLIMAYSNKYNVDVSHFSWKNFIAPEGDTILPSILKLFKKPENKRSDLTILNLVDGIISGQLHQQIIDNVRC